MIRTVLTAAIGMALLAGTLSPLAGVAQEASPAAVSPTVAFCGLQDGGGLDRSMTQSELDTYFGSGLPTYSWYPSERGCAGDTPFVTFDDAGTFLGFLEPAAPEETPSAEAAQPAEPEPPAEPAATSEPEAPAEEPVADPLATLPAEQAPEGEQPDAGEDVAAIATSIPEPTPTPTVAETWASREGKIAVCLLAFESPVYAEWMTPEEYERFAAEWEQAGKDDELGDYGLNSIVGFGDMTNFGACTTENGVLKTPEAPVICRTVGPNGERIPVSIIPNYAAYSRFNWDDVPDITGRCPGDPRWSEIGERVDVSWMNFTPIGAPQEMADADVARIAEIHRLQDTGEIGDFYFPPNDDDVWVREVDLIYSEAPGLVPVCIDGQWDVSTVWVAEDEIADLAAEAAAVDRAGVSRDGVLSVLWPADRSNHDSCATESGTMRTFDASRYTAVCRPRLDADGVLVAVADLTRLGSRWGDLDTLPDPVTGACPPIDPNYQRPKPTYDAPELPENIVVYGGI